MKKVLMVLIASFLMAGCSTHLAEDHLAEEKTYVVESGIVTNETAYVAVDMVTDTSFSDFCTVRDYLYKNTIDGYGVEYDVTFEELKSLLLQISYTEGAEAVKVTKERGFNLLLGTHRYCDDVKIWISIAETDILMN